MLFFSFLAVWIPWTVDTRPVMWLLFCSEDFVFSSGRLFHFVPRGTNKRYFRVPIGLLLASSSGLGCITHCLRWYLFARNGRLREGTAAGETKRCSTPLKKNRPGQNERTNGRSIKNMNQRCDHTNTVSTVHGTHTTSIASASGSS